MATPSVRRMSLVGGELPSVPGGKAQDARRRRLSIAATPKEYAKAVLEENARLATEAPEDFHEIIRGPEEGEDSLELPIRWGHMSRPGNDPMKRVKECQDTFIVLDAFGGRRDQLFVGVFDGHGPNGAHASRFVRDMLPAAWCTDDLEKRPFLAINRGCLGTNQRLSVSDIDVYVSGTTGITTLVRGPKLYVANVGDSRAVLGRQRADGTTIALDLSSDHKPDRPDEMARIVGCGGRVFEWGVPRVWLRDVDMPGLAMARSYGDLAAETVGVFAEPELSEVELSSADRFAIWASDGVWEFMSSQEVVDIVSSYFSQGPQACCEAVVTESTRRWNQEEDVVDDTTIVICFFNFP
jgi:serine/threonine protein phosphatase PrpC